MSFRRYKVLDYNELTGTTQYFVVDPVTGQSGIETVEPTNPITDRNKRNYAQTDERAGWKGDWHKIAELPMSVAMDLYKKSSGGKDRKVLAKFINDKDNRAFLHRPVKL